MTVPLLPKVVLLGKIKYATKEWDALSSIARKDTATSANRSEFIDDLHTKYHDVTAFYKTFDSKTITGRFDKDLSDHFPKTLKLVAHNSAGYDQVDIHLLTEKKIYVSNVPDLVNDATADTHLYLLLGALRNFSFAATNLRKGNWKTGIPVGHDPKGKTLGIIGMGGIGRAIKKRIDPLGFEKVIYHNRNKLSPMLEDGAEYVDLDTLLKTSDVISISIPLYPSTRHYINKEKLEKCKEGVVIINTARGAVIDENALVDALDSGHVRSFGSDVYENEPTIHPGLLKNENVLLLPHVGTDTQETEYKMECLVIENIRSLLEKKCIISPVPEQKYLTF